MKELEAKAEVVEVLLANGFKRESSGVLTKGTGGGLLEFDGTNSVLGLWSGMGSPFDYAYGIHIDSADKAIKLMEVV